MNIRIKILVFRWILLSKSSGIQNHTESLGPQSCDHSQRKGAASEYSTVCLNVFILSATTNTDTDNISHNNHPDCLSLVFIVLFKFLFSFFFCLLVFFFLVCRGNFWSSDLLWLITWSVTASSFWSQGSGSSKCSTSSHEAESGSATWRKYSGIYTGRKKKKTMLNIKEAYGNKYVVITYVVAKQWDEQGMETAWVKMSQGQI